MKDKQAMEFEARLATADIRLDYMDAVFVVSGVHLGFTEGNRAVMAAADCTEDTLKDWLESDHVARGMC